LSTSFCQTGFSEQLQQYKGGQRFGFINEFYQLNNYQFAWLDKEAQCKTFLSLLQKADSLGLVAEDYTPGKLAGLLLKAPPVSFTDSLQFDASFSDAAIHFFSDVKTGNKAPDFKYNGLKYTPGTDSIALLLHTHLKNNTLSEFEKSLQPQTKEYTNILNKLQWLLHITSDKKFKEIKITSNQVDFSNKPLLLRLYQLQVIDSIDQFIEQKTLVNKLITAQKQFDLLNDGALRSPTIKALNVPLQQRIKELTIALNAIRWLGDIKEQWALILNIPSAYLMVYEQGVVRLDSKVIVGKPTTPTPSLTSTIKDVILYPYWNVPNKIATRELLPMIKKDLHYIEAGSFQVLNKHGKILDPYSINWRALSPSFFPYILRQSTGSDNSLGLVKFDFYNPFTVYLHDTPGKGLFFLNKRYFSHGCMRVEQPIELAHLLLGPNSRAIDTLTVKGCLNKQAPIIVAAHKALPVIILYSPVWYDKAGEVKFYDDVYNKLN
jgi:murein L,D-transpeptidase YcbB/YkuD